MGLATNIARPLQLLTRFLQWASAVIVLGLTSFFIHRSHTEHVARGAHLVYQVTIAALSVVFFLPAFISPFLPKILSRFVLLIDVVFSYLWLTSFIFAAQDYDFGRCRFNSPPGVGCRRKRANQAFIFLAFIFTFIGAFLEVFALWAYRREHAPQPGHEKNGGGRQPMDAPANPNQDANATPAGTV